MAGSEYAVRQVRAIGIYLDRGSLMGAVCECPMMEMPVRDGSHIAVDREGCSK